MSLCSEVPCSCKLKSLEWREVSETQHITGFIELHSPGRRRKRRQDVVAFDGNHTSHLPASSAPKMQRDYILLATNYAINNIQQPHLKVVQSYSK